MIESVAVTALPEDADVETASLGYASRFESPAGRFLLERQMTVTRELLADLRGASVLEVGGGHGQTAPALAQAGHPVTVLASTPQARHPSLDAPIASGAVSFTTGDLRNPPSGPRSFDVVLSYRLFAHARDLEALISGMTSAARRAVIVDYATTRSFNAVAEPFFAAKKKVETNTRTFLVQRDGEIENLFRAQGFKRTARRPQFFWPMALHRALGAPVLSKALEGAAGFLGLRALFGSPVIARFDRV